MSLILTLFSKINGKHHVRKFSNYNARNVFKMARRLRKAVVDSYRRLYKIEPQFRLNLTHYNGLPMYIQFIKKLFFPFGYGHPPVSYQLAYAHRFNGPNQDDNRFTIQQLKQDYKDNFKSTDLSQFFGTRSNKEGEGEAKDEPIKVQIMNKNNKWFNYIFWIAMIAMMFFLFNTISNPQANLPIGEVKFNIENNVDVTFDDVIGNDEAKEDLGDIIYYLRNPEAAEKEKLKLPKGVLLVGPPGTGKTLLARAVAGESDVPFIVASGSEFEEMFVGVGARRVRELFNKAKENAPCIVFIDEIDAVGSRRDDINTKTKMTLNQLLVEMDGFSKSDNIVVMAATNFYESLDPALIRTGRFDRKVYTSLPSSKERKQLLDFYLKDKNVSKFVNTGKIALSIPGFSGSDIETLVNWAHLQAVKEKTKIKMKHLEDAVLNVAMGRERKSLTLNPKTKLLCAYHEGGHALVSLYTKGALEIARATLVPRGSALGMVNYLEKDDPLKTYQELLASMDTAMGGRAAEEIIFGPNEVTQGAGSDFQKATEIARNMVTKLGMSSLGPMYIGNKRDNISPETQKLVDLEIQRILNESYERAKKILKEHETQLHYLAKALVKYETLTLDEIKRVINGQTLPERDREMNEMLRESKEEVTSSTVLIPNTNVEQNIE